MPSGRRFPSLSVQVVGSGPPLALFHGGAGSHSHWCRNIPELRRRFTVHAFDLPGFGASPAVPEDFETSDYLQWVAAETDRIGNSFGLAGFSFGGAVAAAIAAELGSRVERLTLIGPAGFGEFSARSTPLRRMPPAGGSNAERRAVVAHNLGIWMLRRAPDLCDPVVEIQSDNLRRAHFDSRRISNRNSLLGDLRRACCPVQVLWGAEDVIAMPSVAARAAAIRSARPDSELHLISGAGHWAQYEAAEAVNALLIAYHSRGCQA